MNRKRVILVALLAVLTVCLLYAYLATPRLEKAAPDASNKRARANNVQASGSSPVNVSQGRINFAFLDADPENFPGAKRDIFRFGKKRPVRTEPVVKVVKPPIEKPVEEVIEKPVVPIAEVQKSLGRFTFLGFLDKAGEKTIFLSDGSKLYLVKRGESFGGYQVADIEGNLLKVDYAGWDGLLEIPLIEKEKLSVSIRTPARREPRPEVSIPQEPEPRTAKPRRSSTQGDDKSMPSAEGDVLEGEVNGTNQ